VSALLALLLASAELTPPPAVEAPEPSAPVEVEPEEEADLASQLTFGTLAMLNGAWVGLNVCALGNCFSSSGNLPALSALLGAGAGAGYAYAYRDLTGEWGRGALMDSGMAAGAIASFWLASRHFWPSSQFQYLVAAGLDVAATAGLVALAPQVSPRPEAVWLADSLALWGVLIGNFLSGFVRAPENDPAYVLFGGAAAGGLAGAMLAASAARMSAIRFWAANAGALLGGLLLGGGLAVVEQLRSGPIAFNPAVPGAGAAAGIAAGFLVGFAFSESW
jgi:hypothetical protein